MFNLKKYLISQPWGSKNAKCDIFSTFLESHLKRIPKVGALYENLLIGNVGQTSVEGPKDIYWDYVISFSNEKVVSC